MPYRDSYVLNLGAANTGATIAGTLYTEAGAYGVWADGVLSKFPVEILPGSGSYLLDTDQHPDGFSGTVVFTGQGAAFIASIPTSANMANDPNETDGVEPGLTEAEWRRAVISILGGLVSGVQPLAPSTYSFSNWDTATEKLRLEYSSDAVGNRLSKTVLDLDP